MIYEVTVADSSTPTGKAPDIARYEQYGLCCASFVTYYVCNYLPNIEGADTQFITDAINATGWNSQAVVTWQKALNGLVDEGKIEKIGTSASNVNRSKLTPGDLIIFGDSENSHKHIAVYYGTSLSGLAVDEYAVTDKNGVATFKDVLISGHESYTLEEVDTAERYIVPDSQRTAIEWNVVTEKSFYNELKRGDLQVKKTSEDGFVQGMKFHLYGTSFSGIKVDEYATTDSNGIAYFNDILMGTGYTIEEVNTPIRYVIPDRQTADIAWDELTEVEFENILKKWRADVYNPDFLQKFKVLLGVGN